VFHSTAGRCRILTTALCAGTFHTAALVAQSGPRYASGWWDVVAVVGGGVVAGAGLLVKPPSASCAPCDPSTLTGLDRGVLAWHSATARGASDVLVVGVGGGAMLASVVGLPAARARGDVAVLANAVSWTTAATQWLKLTVHRPRPVLYGSDAAQAAGLADNRESFPSGHTSVAFAAATSYATLAVRQHLPHATRNAIMLYLGAAGVGALRVAGGRHFPTDVLAGAALGSVVGWATARLHPRTP
jgi:membrane-associated phospholipid phosphatase